METLMINAKLDNSGCEKDLEKIKLKLFRDVIGYSQTKRRFADSRLVIKKKFKGVGAGKVMENMKLDMILNEINKSDKYMEKSQKNQKKRKSEPEDISL